MTSGPLSSHQREHLLRLVLEAILEVVDGEEPPQEGDVSRRAEGTDVDQTGSVLAPMLMRFDTYESAQLRRAAIDLGARMLDSAEWRSALQRRGHELIEEQQNADGLTDGDTTEEIISLVNALSHTGDSRIISLIDTIRRGTRRREVVVAARRAIDRLDATR